MDQLLVITLAMSCLPLGDTYSSGAPSRACHDMFPEGHGVDSQESKPPYSIRVSQTVYKPNSTYLTVEIAAYNGEFFEGFFLQAKSLDCRTLLGEFKIDYKDSNDTQYVECDKNNKMAAVSHSLPAKRTSKRFTWYNSNRGDLYFQATFVKSYRTFWTGVKSVVVRDQNTLNMTSDIYPAPCSHRAQQDMFPSVYWGDGNIPLPELVLVVVLALTLYLL